MGIQAIFGHKYTQLLLCVVVLSACEQKIGRKKPKDLIPEEKYVRIMADIMVLEAYSSKNVEKFEGTPLQVMKEFVYPEIQKKYQLSDSALQHSYRYYISDADQYNTLTIAIIDTLRAREQKIIQPQTIENLHPKDKLDNKLQIE